MTTLVRSSVRLATLTEIVALKARGALPPSTDFHGPHPDGHVPSQTVLDALEWWIAGDPERPSAYMALRTVFDLQETRDELEIVGIEGNRIGVGRLIAKAMELGRARGLAVFGDVPRTNTAIAEYVRRARFKIATVRWRIEPNG